MSLVSQASACPFLTSAYDGYVPHHTPPEVRRMEAFHLALVIQQLENPRGAHVIREIRKVFVVPHHLGATARVVGVDVGERATAMYRSLRSWALPRFWSL